MRGKVVDTYLPGNAEGKIDIRRIITEGLHVGTIKDKYGKKFDFILLDWHSGLVPWPSKGDEVDFVPLGEYARKVFSLDPVTEIIQRFPGPVTLRSRWQKNILPAIFIPIIGVIGVGLLLTGKVSMVAVGVVLALLGLGGSIIYWINLIPGGSGLVLDRDGFEVTNIFRKRAYAWNATMLPDHPGHDKKNTVQRRMRDPHYYGLDSFRLTLLMHKWCKLALGLSECEISYWPPVLSDEDFLGADEKSGPSGTASRDVSDTTEAGLATRPS